VAFAQTGGVSPARICHAECERIIQLLKEERERRGLSKYAVAQGSGLSQPSIGYIEKGLRIPSLETVLRLAQAMKADLPEIIKRAQMEISAEQTKHQHKKEKT
jgi:transcriptional regulator with XRE-family HTH domain